jgi:PAS domain S-box-containing protein
MAGVDQEGEGLAAQAWEASCQAIFQRAGVGLVEMDLGGRIRAVNPAISAMLGWPRGELVGGEVLGFVAEPYREAARQAMGELVDGWVAYYVQERPYQRADGGLLWLEVHASRMEDENGRPFGILGVAVDIQARKEAEQALQRERAELEERVAERTRDLERLRAQRDRLLNNLGEGLLGMDREGSITFLNPRAQELLGWSDPDSRLGTDAFALLQCADLDGTPVSAEQCPFRRALAEGRASGPWRLRLHRADGNHLPVEMHVNPAREDGTVTGLVVLFTELAETPDPLRLLTPREQEVLHRLLEGRTNKGAARELGVSDRTVETHRARIMAKLEVGSFAELVQLCSGIRTQPQPQLDSPSARG